MMASKDEQKQFSTLEYWEQRYANLSSYSRANESSIDNGAQESNDSHLPQQPEEGEDGYEWFRRFEDIRPFLEAHLPGATGEQSLLRGEERDADEMLRRQTRLVHLGCGASTLPAQLADIGYQDQTCVDFSPVLIRSMQERYAHLEGLQWAVMDVRDMKTFSDGSWRVSAGKKGTLDAMLYGSLWDPDDEVKLNVKQYVDEVARILSSSGKWLYVTFRQPHFIKPLLQRPGIWTVEVHSLTSAEGGLFEYFGYVLAKG